MHDSYSNSLEQSSGVDNNKTNPDIFPIIAFDVLQIIGLITISIILCIVWFSPHIRRSTAWFSHIFGWSFSCIGYLLLIGQQTGHPPGPILCLCQAMLLDAFPTLNALTFAMLTLEIFLAIFHPFPISRITMIVLFFVIPYGTFACILVMVFILGLLNPMAVQREPFGMYCHMRMSIEIVGYLISLIIISCITASLVLGGKSSVPHVLIVHKCRRHWNKSRILLSRNGTPIGLVVRVGILGAFAILGIGLAIINIFRRNKTLAICISLTVASLPAVVGIIFASQRDILRVLVFWRKPSAQVPPITSVTYCTSKIMTNVKEHEDPTSEW